VIGDVYAFERKEPLTSIPRVSERKERRDHVARPRVVELLETARSERSRTGGPTRRRAFELGRRLLPEAPEEIGTRARGSPRARPGYAIVRRTHHEPDDDGVDSPTFSNCDPRRRAEHGVDEPRSARPAFADDDDDPR